MSREPSLYEFAYVIGASDVGVDVFEIFGRFDEDRVPNSSQQYLVGHQY